MRNITPEEIQVEFHTRQTLRKRYALQAELFSDRQLRVWSSAVQVKSPPRGGFFVKEDVERLDTVYVALRVLKQNIKFFTNIINSGVKLDKWMEAAYGVTLLYFLENHCPLQMRNDAPVINVINCLRAKEGKRVNNQGQTPSKIRDLFTA
jgi:hypothetical protein